MVYFRCTSSGSGKGNTVIVTCAEQFAGVAVTIAKIGKSYTKVCPLTAPYVIKFYGLEAGTYTVSATVSGQTYSTEVIVQDVSCVLNYGFTWKLWVDTASKLDSSDYASLSEVLADEEAVRELFTEHACVDYMADSTSSNADLETIIENDLCAKWINNSDYALDFLGANTAIKALMDTAGKYGYGEWVNNNGTWGPKGNVPVMTSNTAPYGAASASGQYSSDYAPYKAFNGVNSSTTDCWISAQNSIANAYLSYTSPNPICVKAIKLENRNATTVGAIKNFKLQGSNDGSNWTDISTLQNPNSGQSQSVVLSVANDNYYLKYRILVVDAHTEHSSDYVAVGELQFYGRELKVSVPVMTSNTAPFGEASASSIAGSGNEAYRACDGDDSTLWASSTSDVTNARLQYEFTKPMIPKIVKFKSKYLQKLRIKTFTILGSNDGIAWDTIREQEVLSNTTTVDYARELECSTPYKYLALAGLTTYQSDIEICALQFYGLDYSEKEFEEGTTKKWLYDHGVELETIDALSSDNNVNNYVTKKDDELYIHKQGSNSGAAAITNTAIDLTPFSLIRAKCGDELINMRISVRSAKSVNDNVDVAVISIGAANANLPNNLSLDVSAVNQSGYPTIGLYQGGTSDENYMTVKEFWLE